jgi:hypothetical protein
MGKYDPLSEYLREQNLVEMTLSFRQIEKIIGGSLPAGAISARWWANDGGSRTAQVQRLAWTGARYHATLHAGRKVRFKKIP